jgi:hypothetical protein
LVPSVTVSDETRFTIPDVGYAQVSFLMGAVLREVPLKS